MAEYAGFEAEVAAQGGQPVCPAVGIFAHDAGLLVGFGVFRLLAGQVGELVVDAVEVVDEAAQAARALIGLGGLVVLERAADACGQFV